MSTANSVITAGTGELCEFRDIKQALFDGFLMFVLHVRSVLSDIEKSNRYPGNLSGLWVHKKLE